MHNSDAHMENTISPKKQIALIVLCWAAYTLAYFGRYSYTSNGIPIQKFYEVSKEEFSLATTFFFFAYGVGQIINGILCRRYNMRFMIFGALIISAVINLSVFSGIPFYLIKYLWLLNGLCQSVLWASLLRILSCYIDKKRMKTAILFMSTTVSIGTFVIYGISALFNLFDGFKYVFLFAFAFVTAVALIWVLFYSKLTDNARLENESIIKAAEEKVAEDCKDLSADRGTSASGKVFNVFLLIIILFCVYAIAINFAKDGLTTWIPQILNEQYALSDSLSIILTLVLPVFGIAGALAAVFLNKFIKEYSDILGIFFAIAAACVLGIIFLFKTDYWYLTLVLFGLISLFMHGANNVVTSMFPLSLGRKHNAGLVGGLLNGACYVGSTLSQYIIAIIATAGGWGSVMNVLMYFCAVLAVLSLAVCIIRVAVLKSTNIKIK